MSIANEATISANATRIRAHSKRQGGRYDGFTLLARGDQVNDQDLVRPQGRYQQAHRVDGEHVAPRAGRRWAQDAGDYDAYDRADQRD